MIAIASATLVIGARAQGAVLTYALTYEFSGATPPEGPTPWLKATFDDGGSAGSVDLTLKTPNLTDAEFVFQWLFNLDPALDPNLLVFSAPVKTGMFTDPTINTGVNAFLANGDGMFDIQVRFDNTDGAVKRFGVGDAVEYTITGIPTLTAYSFDYLSDMDGGQGTYPTAAHVGGIGPSNSDSGWISVPEPGALTLLLAGSLALRRRRV